MKKMKTILTLALTLLFVAGASFAQTAPPAEDQIAASVLAAPEDRRAGAAVLGYNAEGALVTLREGSNDLICLADDPKDDSFSVACYHRDLEPFMARGRELRAEGVTGRPRSEIRFKEIEEGRLSMSRQPRALYVLSGSGFDAAKGEVTDSYLRWVLYLPFATAASTGLSTKGSPNAPWLMGSGTAGAHIMINPPRKK